MLAANFRELWNKFILSFGKASRKLGLTPNFWTLFSLFMAFLAGITLYQGRFWWGLVLSVGMFFADALDGATARAMGNPTTFGMVFDHVIDRYAEFIILAGLLIGGWISPGAIIFAISGMIMASYVRAKAESNGVEKCIGGIAGRIEKLFFVYLAIFLLALGVENISGYLIWFVGAISHVTAIQRLLYARDYLLYPERLEKKRKRKPKSLPKGAE
ncbi:MAG: CDP-alcohol phosphatidyltransferase family protein [Anaerolineales bacterium]|nr:CDP-alcohol phosphatidyltransferase family protein [Anaerolineales bacterium]